jgi:hypothetical protein
MADPNADVALRACEIARGGKMRELAALRSDGAARLRCERALMSAPPFAALYRRRAQLEPIEADDDEPRASLAATLRDFRAWYGLQPEFLPGSALAAHAPIELAVALLTRDHDVYHVLCEYETSDADEVALQSFLCGQAPCVFAGFIAGVLHAHDLEAQRFKHLRDVLESELDMEAFMRGRRARTLVTCDLAALAHRPVAQLRRALAIEPRAPRTRAETLENTCGGRRARPYFSQPSAAGGAPL